MADTIEAYLLELRAALAGADPALVQDAVYDAEEYLRSATAEGGGTSEAMLAAIDAYGAPDEIAVAYKETERTVVAALRRPVPTPKSTNPIARFVGVIADPGAWGALFYMLLSLATGAIYFTVVVTGLSLSAGLMVLIIGVPVLLLFIAAVRAISLAEGRMVEGLLGVRMPRRPRIVGTGGGTFWERLKSWITDYRTWATMLYMLLMLPLGITYFTVIVTALTVSLALVVTPVAQAIFHFPIAMSVDGGAMYGYYLEPWGVPLVMALGVLGFFVTLWLSKGVGYLHGLFAKVMLVGRFESDPVGAPVGPVGSGQAVSPVQPDAGN
ncbi:MAG: sensor domain-containing protein [Coriobacteriia bacterium]|nr:sensor domain-containing protein [Coriobacteriia bacterium]